MVQVETELTRQDYLHVLRYLKREECKLAKSDASGYWAETLVTAIFWVPVGAAAMTGFSTGTGTGLLFMAALVSLATLPKVTGRLRLRARTRLPARPVSQFGPKLYTATGDGLRIEWAGGKTDVDWPAIQRVVERNHLILLMVGGVSAHVIADRAFADMQERARFLDYVKERIKAHRVQASGAKGLTLDSSGSE